MENRIMFLIIAVLGLYLVFTPTGQTYMKKYLGIVITPKTSTPAGGSSGSKESKPSTTTPNTNKSTVPLFPWQGGKMG
jgi:hypothetical protein